jgi:hypothetical protein
MAQPQHSYKPQATTEADTQNGGLGTRGHVLSSFLLPMTPLWESRAGRAVSVVLLIP